MSEEYSDPAAESEMRRRAAWFLGMLVVVAILLVGMMALFLKGGGSSGQAAPSGPPIATAPPAPASSSSGKHSGAQASGHSKPSATASASSSQVHQPPHAHPHQVSCPSDLPCVAPGDIGNAVAAINSYRQAHGVSPVNGRVSNAAQQCALTNGGDCNGSWAESQVPSPNGQQALQKVLPFAHSLLDSGLKSLDVGWAYDPAAHQYYFALIQNS